jgi:outer membrane protein, multidrug efflux system
MRSKVDMPSKLNATVLACVCLLSLSACSLVPVAPAFQKPLVELPQLSDEKIASVDWLSWWKSFKDPVLDSLLAEAAQQSLDLAVASSRIDEARAGLNQNRSNFYPSVDLNAGASRRGNSENAASSRPGIPLNSTDLQYGFVASYEIDFWGKYARADDAARARMLNQTANRGTVLVTLYANVAQGYFNLRALDAQLAFAEKTFATRQENLKLQERRFSGGVVGDLDVQQARSEAASVEASVLTLKQNKRNTESALALLLGRKPADIYAPVIARGATIEALYEQQVIPASLPSDVLNRRPDVIAAEQTLRANNADLALARTAYYPRLSLSAGLGQQSKEFSNLFSPSSIFWNMIGNLAQPIFRAGAVDAAVAAATARQTQAVAQYTQVVQVAFKEAHDSFNNIEATREIAATNKKRIEALKTTLRLSELRYKGGYSNYLEVLSAQRDLAQAEIALIDTQRAELNALVSLYKAAGGGWDNSAMTAQK